jgi:hypothetical protein
VICAVLPHALLRLCGLPPSVPDLFARIETVGFVFVLLLEDRWLPETVEEYPPALWDFEGLESHRERFEKLRKYIIDKVLSSRVSRQGTR